MLNKNSNFTMGGEGVRIMGPRQATNRARSSLSGSLAAFTLIELLVVMAIIGILAGIGLPALKGLSGGTGINSANRQLSDDLAYARLKAINDRTTVYVVFVPPSIVEDPQLWNPLSESERNQIKKLWNGQYTTYALYAKRKLGDQPGPGTSHYLTEWRSLPDGVFIKTNEFRFLPMAQWQDLHPTNRPLPFIQVPFPTAQSDPVPMPCIAFDYQGRLLFQGDEVLPLSRGRVVYAQDENNQYLRQPAEVVETPKDNWMDNPTLRIDWLTGRTRTEEKEL